MITDKQAIEAIKTIKKFCQQVSVEDCEDEKCPIRKWCNQHITNGVPEEWEDEAGEQHETDRFSTVTNRS